MTGFIGRLFGSKDKAVEKETKAEAPAPTKKERPAAVPSPKGAFFLDTDSASSMGDVDYMRAVKKVKRTYARTVDSPDHVEQVKEISALNGKISVGNNGSTAPTAASEPQPSVPQNNETQQRRRSDSSMDMFRNMAKDIRK
ncbi:MAG: hypothetical protein LH702_01560 [Phormidesmis sp. CAN_BIN44]|nr:hypothetical protein [Phormidesmis sp. CAN_BIN44]